ncbi:hypothetical protein Tco_0986753, partial [Tanacetum coccineum]
MTGRTTNLVQGVCGLACSGKKPVENNSQAEVEIDSTTKKETSSTIKKDNNHGSRAAALFNNLEEGGSRDIIDDDHENDKSLNSLQDRVVFLKR